MNPVQWLREPRRGQTTGAVLVGLVVGWALRDAPHYLAHTIGGVDDLSADGGIVANAFEGLLVLVVVFFFVLALSAVGLGLVIGTSVRLWHLGRGGRQSSLLVKALLAGGVALLVPGAWFLAEPALQSWFGLY